MFKSINARKWGEYEVIDTNFTIIVEAGCCSEAIVRAYQPHGISSVVKNIIEWFRYSDEDGWEDRAAYMQPIIDHLTPELQYGTKYHPCVMRQIKQLQFGKGKH